MKSILQKKDGTCFLCRYLHGDASIKPYLHKHHIYGGALRKASEKHGFYVYLCVEHHETGPEAVHNARDGQKYNLLLKYLCEVEFEKTHTEEEFRAIVHRSYLWAADTVNHLK